MSSEAAATAGPVRPPASPRPVDAGLRFGRCEVSTARREIRLDGREVAVAPKVFDLLVFLIERRPRVVRREELLDAIWSGVVVSDSVVARAVMKARQAIGDSAADPKLLKTFHRVGYAFVAEVIGIAAEPSTTKRPAREPAALRVAVLPFENGADAETLQWVSAGLSGVVAQALRADLRLQLVDPFTVADAVATRNASAEVDRSPEAVMAVVGADCTVQATLKSSAAGFKLHYRIRGVCDLQGHFAGAEPTALGQRLANLVESALFPGASWPVPFESSDALANQAFARAIDLYHRQKWGECARLLEIVLDVEPGSACAALHYLRVLANLEDIASLRIGEQLLARATRDADLRLLAATHEALAHACFNMGGEWAERSQEHRRQALSLAHSFEDEEWIVRIYLGEALACQMSRDYARADAFYERAWNANESAGNQMRRALILGNRAGLEYGVGRMLVSIDHAEQALAICDRLALAAQAMEVRASLSRAKAALGLFARAAEQDEANLDHFPKLQTIDGDVAAFALLVIAENAFETRDPLRLARAVERHAVASAERNPEVQATARVAEAHLAALEGDAPAMLEAMRTALLADIRFGLESEKTHQWMLDWLEMSLRLDEPPTLRCVVQRVEALSARRRDDALRGALRRARAAALHADGDSVAARAALLEAIELLPPGRLQALARLDAAWLSIEADEAPHAARLVREIGPWLLQHPIGLAVSARLHHASGRMYEGRVAIEACVESLDERFPQAFEPLRRALGKRAEATPAEPLPRLQRLPTLL